MNPVEIQLMEYQGTERKPKLLQLDLGKGVNMPQIQRKPDFVNSAAHGAVYITGSSLTTEKVVS